MADEPSLGEVVRGLDKLEKRLEQFIREFSLRVVDTNVYGRDQREWERRFTEMQRDLDQVREACEKEREAREKADKALAERMEAEATTKSTNWRQMLYAGLIPTILFLLGLLIQILQMFKGGK